MSPASAELPALTLRCIPARPLFLSGCRRQAWLCCLLALLLLGMLTACNADIDADPASSTPISGMGPQQLAVVVNDDDPLSRQIADYYVNRRQIPAVNVIHVRFAPGDDVMRPQVFRKLKADIDSHTPAAVQAYALAWTSPYRVGCMSITTAFAAGYDEDFCARGCKPTRTSPYFDSRSARPFDDHGWRPAMLLAGESFEVVRTLIDRGIDADGSHPAGTAYLLSTTDHNRNTRSRFYPGVKMLQSDRFNIQLISGNTLQHRRDVMFYFTGLAQVTGIDTNTYLPGAIADHLTSAGGKLTGSRQMSSLRWLEAGATGSYGTVVEPCAFVQKFPRPHIVIDRYLDGETLIEAYWKSVEWPGQGVFIGEPLAAPFRR